MRFPHNQSMNPCVETIYQSIFVQAKGTLRKEIASLMRQGRARRHPAAYARGVRPRFKDPMVMISERPVFCSALILLSFVAMMLVIYCLFVYKNNVDS